MHQCIIRGRGYSSVYATGDKARTEYIRLRDAYRREPACKVGKARRQTATEMIFRPDGAVVALSLTTVFRVVLAYGERKRLEFTRREFKSLSLPVLS